MSARTDTQSSSLPQSRDGANESWQSKTSLPVRYSFDSVRQPVRLGESASSQAGSDETHQRFVLTDPVAFRYLEEDTSATVIDRRSELIGYQCYVVEQWATSRTHPTFVITTFTGDHSDKVIVGVLSVPTDETKWSPRLRFYFKALNQYHARRRSTPLGIVMITNLSGFPSSLTVIPVPDGDLRRHRAGFFLNENLKRLGCSGRVGMTFASPNGATIAKYHQIYRVSDKIPLLNSVIELVKLCQTALHLFEILDIEYVDGLLCDVTEKAINDWWIGFGSDIYSIEPHDGILGPTTVAALLGLLMGARNRLHALGSPVPKDPFDIEEMKHGISSFQKAQHATRTRRLDRKTIIRLHKATEKATLSEGWSMPRALKSTVAELSGKGGEMLAEVVGRRDRAGIAEIETPDIEHFQQLVFGERCKWVWLGKPRKRASSGLHNDTGDEEMTTSKKDETKATGAAKPTDHIWPPMMETSQADAIDESNNKEGQVRPSFDETDVSRQDHVSKTSMIKRATGLIDEGRSGLDRLRDAVTRRHHTRPSRDDKSLPSSRVASDEMHAPFKRQVSERSYNSTVSTPTDPHSAESFPEFPDKGLSKTEKQTNQPAFAPSIVETPVQSEASLVPEADYVDGNEQYEGQRDTLKPLVARSETHDESDVSPLEGPIYHGIDIDEALHVSEEPEQAIEPSLRRTQSHNTFVETSWQPHFPASVSARKLSYSLAIDSTSLGDDGAYYGLEGAESIGQRFAIEQGYATNLQKLRASLSKLSQNEAAWTQTQIDELNLLLSQADEDQQLFESKHQAPSHAYREFDDMSKTIVRDEKEALKEGRKELETLAAKLDYELSTLKGKVEDVEVGVDDFQRSVEGVERRLDDLEDEWKNGGSWSCIVS